MDCSQEIFEIWKLIKDGHNEMIGDLNAKFLLSQTESYELCGCKFCEAMRRLIFLECNITLGMVERT